MLNEAMFGPDVEVHLRVESFNDVYLGLIKVSEAQRGKGLGGAAMDRLTALADKHSVTMRLQVMPGYERTATALGSRDLTKWYTNKGFVRDPRDPGLMVRYPRT
jgi:GNAT superfamily N-acetyltransferase